MIGLGGCEKICGKSVFIICQLHRVFPGLKSIQWKQAAYDGIFGWKHRGQQAVERRVPGGIRHTGRFLQRRLSHHNLKHCLSKPQILIHPQHAPEKLIGSIFLSVIREDWRRVLSIPLNIIHQLCAVLPQLMKVGRESRDKAIIRCRAGGTAAEI